MSRTRATLWIVLFAGLGAVAASYASGLARDSRAEIFLEPDHPAREANGRLAGAFGRDPFLLISVRSRRHRRARDRAARLARRIEAVPEVAAVFVPQEGSPLTRALHLSGPDPAGWRCTLLVTLRHGGPGAVEAVEAAADDGAPAAAAIAGQPALNAGLDDAAGKVGKQLFPLLALVMAVFLTAAYRSATLALVILGVTGLAVLGGLALLRALHHPVNLITVMLPVLLLALGVALCIHLANAYRRFLDQGLAPGDAAAAMRRAEFQPCLVTSLTTAAGFGSFAFSRIAPLRALGLAMAGSILLAFFVADRLFPALLVWLRPRPREGFGIGRILAAAVPPLMRRRKRLILAGLALTAAGLAALPRIREETNGLHYLPRDHPLRRETARLEQAGVGTASLDLVLRAGKPSPDALAENLDRIERAIERARLPGVRGVVTALTLAREAAFRAGLQAPPAQTAFLPLPGRAGAALARFRTADARTTRVSIQLTPGGTAAYEALMDALARILPGAVDPDLSWEPAGDYPIIMAVQSELIRTLLLSLAASAGVILLILALAYRSVRAALCALLPAAVPLASVVLLCALLALPLSVATVMVLAVMLGIVTDDAVHLLHVIRRGGAGLDETLARVGTAVTETSIAIFFGFAVLVGADFLPTRHFGLLTAAGMLVALAANVLLFPALALPRPEASP